MAAVIGKEIGADVEICLEPLQKSVPELRIEFADQLIPVQKMRSEYP